VGFSIATNLAKQGWAVGFNIQETANDYGIGNILSFFPVESTGGPPACPSFCSCFGLRLDEGKRQTLVGTLSRGFGLRWTVQA